MASLMVAGVPAKKGMEVTTFRGEKAILVDWRAPGERCGGMNGKVYCQTEGSQHTNEWYPSVIKAKFVQNGGTGNSASLPKGGETVTVKDFKKDDTVFIVHENGGRTDSEIYEATVTLVGKKYVTIGDGPWIHRYMDWNSEYLHEKTEWGKSTLLFKTRQAAEEYIEKKELSSWLGIMSISAAEKYSLDQLRKVKKILDGGQQE